VLEAQFELHKNVWSDFVALRTDRGSFQADFPELRPTVVIHGEFDPHPIDGILPFLRSCICDVHPYILPDCGHYRGLNAMRDDSFSRFWREI